MQLFKDEIESRKEELTKLNSALDILKRDLSTQKGISIATKINDNIDECITFVNKLIFDLDTLDSELIKWEE